MKLPTKPITLIGLLTRICGSKGFVSTPGTKFLFQSIIDPTTSTKISLMMTKATKDIPTQEWDVKRYQDQRSFVWEYGSSLVEILDAQSGERILDVGCGSGELTQAIVDSVTTDDTAAAAAADNPVIAMGMDSDPQMIVKAQEQFPGLEFFVGDVRNFHVEPESFDAIFSNAALHWVATEGNGVERSVQAMSRALKSGGRFVVEFGGKGNVKRIVEATQEALPGVKSPWYFPSISEYSTLLEKNGIEVLSASLFDRPTPLGNYNEGIKNWLRMFGSFFWEGRSDEEVEAALNQIEEKLRPHLCQDGNHWVADYRRIRIVGQKVT